MFDLSIYSYDEVKNFLEQNIKKRENNDNENYCINKNEDDYSYCTKFHMNTLIRNKFENIPKRY